MVEYPIDFMESILFNSFMILNVIFLLVCMIALLYILCKGIWHKLKTFDPSADPYKDYDVVRHITESTGHEPYSRYDTCDETIRYTILKHKITGEIIKVPGFL